MATSKDEIDRRRREQMMELLKKGEDPAFVRYAMWREYGDTAAIDKDLQTIQELTGGQPTTPKKVEGITVNGETFTPTTYAEASKYQEEQKKKETEKYQAATVLNEKLKNFEDLLSDTEGLKASAGTNVAGRSLDLPLNIYTDPDRSRFAGGAAQALSKESLQSLIDAKAAGATFGALSDQELKMLQQSASKLGQWAIIKDGKITGFNASEKDVKKELKNLKEQTKIALSKVEEKPEQPTQIQDPQIEQAKQWLQENPNDPRAEKVRAKLGLSKETDFTKTKIGELSVEKAMGTVGTEEVTPTITQEVIKKPSTLSKIANFLGVKKFGEGIGATYFLMSKEGKELQKKAEEGDKFALETLNAILDEAPTSKEVRGSAALTALNIASAGTLQATGTSVAKQAIKTGVIAGAKSGLVQGAKSGAAYGSAYGIFGELNNNGEATAENLVRKAVEGGIKGGIYGGIVGSVVGGASGAVGGRSAKKAAQQKGFSDDIIDAQIQAGERKVDFNNLKNKFIQEKAITQGFEQKDINFLASLSKNDRVKANSMLKLATEADQNIRIVDRPIDIAGETLVKKLELVDNVQNKAGIKVGEAAKSLRGVQIDTTAISEKVDELLSGLGVTKGKKGFNWNKSVFKYNPEIQKKLTKFFEGLPKGKTDAYDLHIAKKAIDEVVDYGVKGEGLKGESARILKALRSTMDNTLDSNFKEYNKANTEFKLAKDLATKAQDLFGKKNKTTGEGSQIRAGQVLRSAFSNNTTRGRVYSLAQELDNFETAYKGKVNEKALDQALFAERLERSGLFETQAITGLKGQVESAVKNTMKAASFVKNPIEGVGQIAATAIEKIQNISPEQKRKVLEMMLK